MDSIINQYIEEKLQSQLIVTENEKRKELFKLLNRSIYTLEIALKKLNDGDITNIKEHFRTFRHVLETYRKYRVNRIVDNDEKYDGFFMYESQFSTVHNMKSLILYKLIFENVNAISEQQIELYNIIYNSRKDSYTRQMERWVNKRVKIEQENVKPYKQTSSWWMKFTLMSLFALSELTTVESLNLSNNIVNKRGISINEFISLPNKANIPQNDFEKAIISLSGLDKQPDTMYQPKLQDYLNTIYGREIDLNKYDGETFRMLQNGKYDMYKMFTEAQLNPEKMVSVYKYLRFVKTTPYFISGIIDMKYHNTLTMFKYSEKFRYSTKFGIYSLVYSIHHKNSKDTDNVINRIYCLDLLSYRSNGRVSNPKDVDNIAEFIILTDDTDTLSTCVHWLNDIPNAMSLARKERIIIPQISDNITLEQPRLNTTSKQPVLNMTSEQQRVNTTRVNTTLEQPILNTTLEQPILSTTSEQPRVSMTSEQQKVNTTRINTTLEQPILSTTLEQSNIYLYLDKPSICILNEVYDIYRSINNHESYSLFIVFICALIYGYLVGKSKNMYPFRSVLSLLNENSMGMGIFITEMQLLKGRLNRIVDEIEKKIE